MKSYRFATTTKSPKNPKTISNTFIIDEEDIERLIGRREPISPDNFREVITAWAQTGLGKGAKVKDTDKTGQEGMQLLEIICRDLMFIVDLLREPFLPITPFTSWVRQTPRAFHGHMKMGKKERWELVKTRYSQLLFWICHSLDEWTVTPEEAAADPKNADPEPLYIDVVTEVRAVYEWLIRVNWVAQKTISRTDWCAAADKLESHRSQAIIMFGARLMSLYTRLAMMMDDQKRSGDFIEMEKQHGTHSSILTRAVQPKELAAMLGRCPRTIRNWLKSQKIKNDKKSKNSYFIDAKNQSPEIAEAIQAIQRKQKPKPK